MVRSVVIVRLFVTYETKGKIREKMASELEKIMAS